MNAIRGRKGFQRKPMMEDIHLGPTSQTVAKLEADVLKELAQARRITTDQERAGREINAVWEALGRLVGGLACADPGRAGGGGADPIEAMPNMIAGYLHNRHQPWASREIEKVVAPGITRYGIVWRVCNLNWDLELVALACRLPERIVLRALRDSLDVYLDFMRKDKRDAA